MPRYNVLYLHTHDTGREIEPLDPGAHSPNLMQLAQEGTTFRNAYCVNPTCSPSRAALLTGKYPHENGMYGLAHRGFSLVNYEEHLQSFLQKQGYETALFGMQHEAKDASLLGYDVLFQDPRKTGDDRWLWDERNMEAAVKYIQGEHSKPFFLSYGLEHTHKPYPEPVDVDPDFVKVPYPLPDTKETREDYAGFLQSLLCADRCIGKVIQTIKDCGLFDDTIIMYTTDHGIALPHMKCTLFDTGIGVALILSVPGMRSKRVSDAMITHMDVFPTLCEILEVEKPDGLRGESLLGVLEGKTETIHEHIYGEINYHAGRDPQRMIRTGRYKYIRRFGEDHYIPCNVDAGLTKEYLNERGLFTWKIEKEQLYDLILDPGERKNLAKEKEYARVLNELRETMNQIMKETGDFIEEGLPEVDGMIMNKIDCYDADSQDPAVYENGKVR